MARRNTTAESTASAEPTTRRRRAQPATIPTERKVETRIDVANPGAGAAKVTADPVQGAQAAAAAHLSAAAQQEPAPTMPMETKTAGKSETEEQPARIDTREEADTAVAEPIAPEVRDPGVRRLGAAELPIATGSLALQGLQASLGALDFYFHAAARDYQAHFERLSATRNPAEFIQLQADFVQARTENLVALNIRLAHRWQDTIRKALEQMSRNRSHHARLVKNA